MSAAGTYLRPLIAALMLAVNRNETHPQGGLILARIRCITEMGMGVDVHGRDATKAARRAVSDAIRHSSLGFFRMVGATPHDMFVDVTIGVSDPDNPVARVFQIDSGEYEEFEYEIIP